MKKQIHFLILIVTSILLMLTRGMVTQAHATEQSTHTTPIDISNFATTPILNDGRVKPIDTLARSLLKNIYGRDHVDDKNASLWLAESLFDPSSATSDKIFRIENQTTRHKLGLTERKRPLYSFEDISQGLSQTIPTLDPILKKDPKKRTKDEADLLRIHENAVSYTKLLRSLSLILPLNITVPHTWSDKITTDKNGDVSFLALKKVEQDILSKTKNIVNRKGDDFAKYTSEERAIVTFSYQMELLQDSAADNDLLKIIPDAWNKEKGEWYAPWEIYQKGQASPATSEMTTLLKTMADSFNAGDQISFNQAVTHFKEKSYAVAVTASPQKINLEYRLNQMELPTIALILFGITFAAATYIQAANIPAHSILYKAALGTLSGATLITIISILCRIFILSRPPVGTLYESIIFVGGATALIALLMELYKKDGFYLLLGSIAGTGLLLLSNTITNGGDTLVMLSAVLNTQFWLATHVLCITLGYAWCVIVAIIAHLLLINIAINKTNIDTINQRLKSLHSLSLAALLLTAVGTVLGGVWADQSWGRFWGWDPKENGALIAVLWLTWILHAQLDNRFSRPVLLGLLSLTTIVIAFAWIGVNLLGVGLHSYGFTEGLFWGLIIFSVIELGFIGILITKARKIINTHA